MVLDGVTPGAFGGVGGGSVQTYSGGVTSAAFVSAVTYHRSVSAALGTCAAAGDTGKWQTITKTNYVYPCFCEQTGAATYAWTPVTATGIAQGCN